MYTLSFICAAIAPTRSSAIPTTSKTVTRLGSRSWTFDKLNTLTCGFTSQVDEICALTRLNSQWMGSPGFELESPVRIVPHGEQEVTRAPQPGQEIPVEQISGGALARMRPDLSVGAALPPAGRQRRG